MTSLKSLKSTLTQKVIKEQQKKYVVIIGQSDLKVILIVAVAISPARSLSNLTDFLLKLSCSMLKLIKF